ncbi:MAG: hypothetical protein AAB403_04225, partial [Planctomycetota bacterium]
MCVTNIPDKRFDCLGDFDCSDASDHFMCGAAIDVSPPVTGSFVCSAAWPFDADMQCPGDSSSTFVCELGDDFTCEEGAFTCSE